MFFKKKKKEGLYLSSKEKIDIYEAGKRIKKAKKRDKRLEYILAHGKSWLINFDNSLVNSF